MRDLKIGDKVKLTGSEWGECLDDDGDLDGRIVTITRGYDYDCLGYFDDADGSEMEIDDDRYSVELVEDEDEANTDEAGPTATVVVEKEKSVDTLLADIRYHTTEGHNMILAFQAIHKKLEDNVDNELIQAYIEGYLDAFGSDVVKGDE